MTDENSTMLLKACRASTSHTLIMAGTLMLLAGCAQIQRDNTAATENTLLNAGFQVEQPNTTERQKQLASLEPHTMIMVPPADPNSDDFSYVYADPDSCHCLLVGNSGAYHKYRRLAAEQKIAADRLVAADLSNGGVNDDDAFRGGAWDSPLW